MYVMPFARTGVPRMSRYTQQTRNPAENHRDVACCSTTEQTLRQPAMASYLKRLHLLAAMFTLVITALFYLQTRRISPVPTSVVYVCKGTPAKGSFTPLKGSNAVIVAAYFDNRRSRRNATRLIGIAHHKHVQPLYCWFCCAPDSTVWITKAQIDVHSDRFDFPYGATDLYCLEPKNCQPRYVSLGRSDKDTIDQSPLFEIQNRVVAAPTVEFTVCIAPMFGEYNNILQFLQTMEMYKILGVDKVMIYKTSCSQLMEKVLDFYVAEGTVEIIPWPIDSYLNVSIHWRYLMDGKDIGYYGQVTALNDCVYRNMYKSRYVLLNDMDEIILPVKYWKWNSMMQALRKRYPTTYIFLFENHIFPKTIFTPISSDNIASWSAVPGINILEHVIREPDRKHISNPYKMIVDPRKVSQTSVHSVIKSFGRLKIYVRKEVALVYHCRVPLQAQLPPQSLIKDTTIWRYNMTLIKNVNKVLKQTGLLPRG